MGPDHHRGRFERLFVVPPKPPEPQLQRAAEQSFVLEAQLVVASTLRLRNDDRRAVDQSEHVVHDPVGVGPLAPEARAERKPERLRDLPLAGPLQEVTAVPWLVQLANFVLWLQKRCFSVVQAKQLGHVTCRAVGLEWPPTKEVGRLVQVVSPKRPWSSRLLPLLRRRRFSVRLGQLTLLYKQWVDYLEAVQRALLAL